MRYSMYQLSRGTGRTYASIDAGDSTALMRFASASSVVGAERFLERDFLGLSAADAVEARNNVASDSQVTEPPLLSTIEKERNDRFK